jgi:hypothetical protein
MADDGLRPFPPYPQLGRMCRAEDRSVIRHYHARAARMGWHANHAARPVKAAMTWT